MLKNALIAVLFILFVAVSIYGLFQRSQIDDRQRAVILAEEERKQAKAALELAKTNLNAVRDSLERAMLVMMNAKIDAEKARIETQKAKKQYENIHFRAYTDSQRDSVWTALYPTRDSIR